MAKKHRNTSKSKTKKCLHCNYHAKVVDLASHIKFRHESPNANMTAEFNNKGKPKVFFCAACTPLPKSFSSQVDLDQHKLDKKH